MRVTAPAVLAAALLLAGCGSADDDDALPPGGGSGLVQRLSVQEAAGRDFGAELVIVDGALLADGNDVRLCSGFAESYPPQCARPSIRVEGLDLSTVDGLESASGMSWKEGVSLTGALRDGVLTLEREG